MNRGFAPVCVAALVLIALSGVGVAQSKDENNPTPLPSNEINGVIESTSRHQHYYYTFMAGPGEIALTVRAETNSDSFGALCGVIVSVYDEDSKQILHTLAQSGFSTPSGDKAELSNRRRVTMHIETYDNGDNLPVSKRGGKYHLRLRGAISSAPTTSDSGGTSRPECLPHRGILEIKMRDGSIRRIDLSQTQEITIAP